VSHVPPSSRLGERDERHARTRRFLRMSPWQASCTRKGVLAVTGGMQRMSPLMPRRAQPCTTRDAAPTSPPSRTWSAARGVSKDVKGSARPGIDMAPSPGWPSRRHLAADHDTCHARTTPQASGADAQRRVRSCRFVRRGNPGGLDGSTPAGRRSRPTPASGRGSRTRGSACSTRSARLKSTARSALPLAASHRSLPRSWRLDRAKEVIQAGASV